MTGSRFEAGLKIAITVLPIWTAGLYLLGATYHEGRLAAFGLIESMFPMAIDRVLFYGFVALVSLQIEAAAYLWLAITALVLAAAVAATLVSNPQLRERLRPFLDWRRKKTVAVPPSVDAFLDRMAGWLLRLLFVLAIFVLLVVMAYASAAAGKTQASQQADNFKKGSTTYVEVFADGVDVPPRAMQIECTATRCAFWTGDQSIVIALASIKKIVAHSAGR